MKLRKYDEVSVKAMYPIMLQHEELKPYFPDSYPKGRQCQRQYFWDVAHTIFPDEVTKLIIHANSQRFQANDEQEQEERIEVSDAWM